MPGATDGLGLDGMGNRDVLVQAVTPPLCTYGTRP
jgi:hypothetical protein